MYSSSKAVIVWIDDHFLTPTFSEDIQKNAWHKLFGKINSNLYRLLDINIKFIRTAKEAEKFICTDNRFKENIYYYFVVDRKLPYDILDEAVDSNSENILKYLQDFKSKYNCLDFSLLSSGSPDSYAIKNVDYHLKPQNKEFSLPEELRHKILFKIKENIVFIDQEDIMIEKNIKHFGVTDFEEFKDLIPIYPFMGKYRTFVELEEVSKKDFNTLIVLTSLSTSDQFVLQNLYISLYDQLKHYDGFDYYKDDDYNSFKTNGYFDNINDTTDKIQVIRLKKFNTVDFSSIYKYLKYKSIKVFIIDSHDDNISNYINLISKVKVIKIDTIEDDINTKENILFSMVDKYINSLDFDISKSIYSKNNILLLHPLFYRIILDSEIKIDKLDDPSEIILLIQNYLNKLDLNNIGDGNDSKQKILNSLPLNNNVDWLYDKISELCSNKKVYNNLLLNTLEFWLLNSWNINYNINLDNLKTKEEWQKYSFDILVQLINKVDLDDDCNSDFIQIKQTINHFINYMEGNKLSVTKTLWPHEKYPMPIYMLNELHDKSNKKLYIQDKNLNFIDNSIELENDFKSLEYKIEYYRSIFQLINDTYKYLPTEIGDYIYNISQRIQNNEDIVISDYNLINNDIEIFKKISNILLRISINFGILTTKNIDTKKLNYERNTKEPFKEDLAGLGKLISDIRDHIYNKFNIFIYEEEQVLCSSYLNVNKEFLLKIKLLDNKNIKKLITLDKKDLKKIDYIDHKNINNDNTGKDKSYEDKLNILNNITLRSQISNISSYLMQNELNYKIHKHKGAYPFFAYLTDTRNTWEHIDSKAWNRELFIESFIYGYESIWLMQKFILERVYNEKDLPETKYVKLDKIEINQNEYEIFKDALKNKEAYYNYFNKLYNNENK